MPAALIPAAIGAAGAVGGALISSSATNKATNAQTTAFNQTTALNAPYVDTGSAALKQLAGMYGVGGDGTNATGVDPNATFYQTPDYKFTMSEGIKGTDAAAAARGQLDSGATRKAEIAYAGNLASGQFNNYADRLMRLAGLGQASANNQAAAGTTYANNIGNAAISNGNTWANTVTGLAGQAQNYLSSSYKGADPESVFVTPSPYTGGNLGNRIGLPAGVLN